MNIFNVDKIMKRLDQMIDNAIAGRPIENGFDETKMSALETKLSRYLAMSDTGKSQLAEEKMRINRLISDISHQTKTPIANILLYAQLLEESDLAEKEKECVKSLMEQGVKLNFLIASLVKTSRLETGIISVLPKENPVQPLLDAVMDQATPNAESKEISLTCDTTQNSAIFDLKWTTEALYNIVDNAIKYTPCNGTIRISFTTYQLFCRIDVTDTGIGISEEESTKVFSRFYRSPCVCDYDGIGLGLFLAREIIAEQRGYIKVKSVPKQGSTFSVFLPMKG